MSKTFIEYGTSGQKNWRGQELHPVDSYLWFQTKDQEREKLIKLYDELTLGLKDRAKLLDTLIEDLRAIAVDEHEFNQNDC